LRRVGLAGGEGVLRRSTEEEESTDLDLPTASTSNSILLFLLSIGEHRTLSCRGFQVAKKEREEKVRRLLALEEIVDVAPSASFS